MVKLHVFGLTGLKFAEHVCCLKLTSISYSFLNKGQKVLTFWKFDKKKGNYSKMGTQTYLKIAG
jgi:hypothetical protein